jgi:Transposase IS116/IS110/IS902 family
LGHALSLRAIPEGKAKNAPLEAHKIAGLLPGGMLPQAAVYPAARRAPPDLLRRRMPLRRTRAALLAHIQPPPRPYHRPEIGKTLADKAHRDGVAERFPAPAVQKSIEVDLALIDMDDHRLPDLALDLVKTAKAHEAQTSSRLRSIPGVGQILALVLLDDLHEIRRVPRGPAVVSDGRLVKAAKEAAGNRDGTSRQKSGPAALTWAGAEAAVLSLRHNPAGQNSLARLVHQPGQGQALTVLAHQGARAVDVMGQRDTAFELDPCRQASWSGAGEPTASRAAEGSSPALQGWQP